MSRGARLRRSLARHLIPGVVVSLYYFVKFRSIVHPRAIVQLSSRIRIGRKTVIQRYARIIVGGGSVDLGAHGSLQCFSTIAAGDGHVRIGNHVRIGPNCNLLGENHGFTQRDVPIHLQAPVAKGLDIADDVWIGANCVLLTGITVGRGAVIGAGSVVTKDVAPYAVVGGNPARLLKTR